MNVAATTTNFAQNQLVAFDLDAFIDLKEQSTTQSSLDLGSALIQLVNHEQHGMMILVNTAGEKHAAIRL